MAKYRGVLAFDLFCAALTTLCDIALPSIMRTLTNTVSAAALTVDTVLRLAALYFVLRIIDGAASYFMSGIGHIMGVHIETDMRRDAFDHLLRLERFVRFRRRALLHRQQQRFAIAREPGVVVDETGGDVAFVRLAHLAARAHLQENDGNLVVLHRTLLRSPCRR